MKSRWQNTGPPQNRQSDFLDTNTTPGYTSRFLKAAGFAAWCDGGVAQLGERLNGIQEVRGSIPLASMAERIRPGLVAPHERVAGSETRE